MKKVILISLMGLTLVALGAAVARFSITLAAVDSTDSTAAGSRVEPTLPSERLDKIKALKDRIATKVAQLRQQDLSVIGGEIKSVDTDSLLLSSGSSSYQVNLSESSVIETVSLGVNKTEVSRKNLVVGARVAILGTVGQKEGTFAADRVLVNSTSWLYRVGKISAVDATNGTFTLIDKGDTLTVDVEKTTKTQAFNPNSKDVASSGLSKIRVGDHAHVVGQVNSEDATRLTAIRIVTIPNLIISLTPAPEKKQSPTIIPSPTSKSAPITPTPKKTRPTPQITP